MTDAAPEPILPSTRKGRWLVLGILAVALVVRMVVVAEVQGDYVPRTDADHFDYIATELANGNGFGEAILPGMEGPTAMRAPGYPFLLAGIYAVFGDHAFTEALIVNALLGVAVVAMLGVVAAQLLGRKVAAVAMAIAAVHPTMVLTGTSLQLEPLLVTLSLATLAAALQHRRDPRGWRWPVVCGVLLGLTVLTRELGFALLLPCAWLLFKGTDEGATLRKPSRPALVGPLLLAVCSFLVVVPWTIRNAMTLDAFVPITTSAGVGLAGTYNETSRTAGNTGQWIAPWEDPAMAQAILGEEDDPTEVNVDRALRDESLEVIKEHPLYPLEVGFWNTLRMFDLDAGDYSLDVIQPYVPYPRWLVRLAIAAGYATLVLSAVALLLRRNDLRKVPWAVWAVPLTMYVMLVVPLPGSIRYRASLEPFFVLLTALTVLPLVDRLVDRSRPSTSAGAADAA